MYVCICNAVTDSQVRAAAESGVKDLWGLQATLGVATNCGCCKESAADILRKYRQTRESVQSPARRTPAA